MNPIKKPKLIVIGAGVAGMATGVYAQMSGFDSQIFEQHVLPGGCCTSWSRRGYIFDYCIEWLVGTAEGNDANQIWRELGALDGKAITNFDVFNRVVDDAGRSVTFYNDPDRLERHLAEVSPDDIALTKAFCADLRRFVKLSIYRFLKPQPLMTFRERLAMLFEVLPSFFLFWRTAATPLEAFCEKLKSPLLRRAFPNILSQDPGGFPMLPYLVLLAASFNGNAGFPEGGSLGISKSIEERYRLLGGRISYRAKISRILIEGDRAVGVELSDGSRRYADVVVSACDGHSTIYKMLEGKYLNTTIEKLYQEILQNPKLVYPGVVSVFLGVNGDFGQGDPHCTTYLLDEADASALPSAMQKSLIVQHRSRYSPGFAAPGKSVIHCTYFSDYHPWMKLRTENKPHYKTEKRNVASFVQSFLERRYPGLRAKTEILAVASPATTERYTGNHAGSILAWKAFTEAEDLANILIERHGMRLPGLRNFYMAGQWIGGGGLIRAASSGRFVIQFICRDMRRPFQAWMSDGSVSWSKAKLEELPQLDEELCPMAPPESGRVP